MTKALVIGATGQSGSYLCDILLQMGYDVHATYRRTSGDNLSRIKHIRDKLQLHRMDVTDAVSVNHVLAATWPDVVFNMADQDHVGWSIETPCVSFDVTAKGVLNVLDAVVLRCPGAKVFQPVSATMFGMHPPPQHEETPFDPQSPYAICKLAAYHLCRHYRQRYALDVWCGIMFNHDSVRRGGDYLLHAIAKQVAMIEGHDLPVSMKLGGSPNTRVDIGCAREFMEGVVDMLNRTAPDDFVMGTGVGHSIGDMVQAAMRYVDREWDLNQRFESDENYHRQGPQPTLIADIEKARTGFGFAPKRTSLDLVRELVDYYLARV